MTTKTRRGVTAPAEKRQARWWLKACPKCGGDLYEEDAWGEKNVVCLLCGRTLTRAEEMKLGLTRGEEDIWGLGLPAAKTEGEEEAA